MTCSHLWIEGLAHTEGRDDTVKEYGRLSHLGLLQLLIGTIEHDVGDAIAENLISLLKKFFCHRIGFVKILTHSYKLSSLSGKYKCFHFDFLFYLLLFIFLPYLPISILSGCKITTFF